MDITVHGHLGRTYTSIAAARKDWKANKDFICVYTGRTISKSCQPAGVEIWLRYNNDRKKDLLS